MKCAEDLTILLSVRETAYVRVVLVEDVSLVFVSEWVCLCVVKVSIIQASYELPEFGRVCVEGSVFEYLFPFGLLFFPDI